jgi:O-antigen/teichoic acid export membrane protein
MSIKKNTLWNLFGALAPLAVGVVAVPYLIEQIGMAAFGVLTLVWTLIGYFSLFDMGLGRALTQQVAVHRAEADVDNLRSKVVVGILLTLAAGVVGSFLLGLAVLAGAAGWLGVDEDLRGETQAALWVAVVGIPLTTVTAGLRGVLEGYERFRAVNVLKSFLGTMNFLLPMAAVAVFDGGLVTIVAALVIGRVVVLGVHLILVMRLFPAAATNRDVDHRRGASELLSFGAWSALSNVISPLLTTVDRFLISSRLGAAVVAHYTVPFEVVTRLLLLPLALTSAAFPRMTSLYRVDLEAARRLYWRTLGALSVLMGPICLACALAAQPLLYLWLGAQFATEAAPVVMVLALGAFFNAVAHVPYTLIQASGQPKTTALFHLVQAMVYVPCLVYAIDAGGVLGAAWAWTARTAVDLAMLLAWVHTRTMKRPVATATAAGGPLASAKQ